MPTPGGLRRLRRTLTLISRYRNWRELRTCLDEERPPTRAWLRNGLRIECPDNHKLLATLAEVVFQRRYTPPGFAIGPQDVVVDIGANIGIFSLFAAARTGAAVHAYEPSPENFRFLERNLAQNGARAVVPHQEAVADKDGSVILYLGLTSGGNKLFDRVQGPSPGSVTVPSVTLERVMEENRLERIDFLKVDCEGAEGLIFAAASGECLGRVGKIALEFHDDFSPLRHEELQRRLEETGFRTRLRWNGKSSQGYLYARRPG
jgi:FkbM family methyltransferase